MDNQKQKAKQKEKRANMTKEMKEAIRKKDRLQKQKKAQEKWNLYLSQEGRTKDDDDKRAIPPKTPFSRSAERESDRLSRRKVRKGMSEAEKEYESVYNLLKMRNARKNRDGKEHLLDNLRAKQGMRDLKEKGRVVRIAFMRRCMREKDEEVLWWSYWKKGKMYKNILKDKRPETAAALTEKEDMLQKKEDERKKIEDELNARGRWIFDNDEYYWSIPNENGHLKSLAEYEAEWEANEPKLSPEEEEKKRKKEEEDRKRDIEMWKKHDEEMERWYAQEKLEKRAELARKQKERREQKKKELLKPIDCPKQMEKGEYEKVRDKTIMERHNAMKESGMFGDNELQAILHMII